MKLSANTIFITGGTSGIGRGLGEAFHQRGNKVIIAGRRKALLDEIAQANPGIDTVVLDINDPVQIKQVAQQVIERHPDLNVVINNAGVMPFDNAASGDLDDAQAVSLLTTNLLGPVRVSAAFVEHLKRQPDAYIINNSSILAFIPIAVTALYSATKAAIHSYSLSQRFMLRDTSVKVLEITPPWVDTDLIHKSGDPRAMPLPDFIAETLAKLETATTEVIVDRIAPLRANVGPNEHGLIAQFNQSIIDNPIPVA
ncbi:SDR family NAD(P)-dependent oxidoreductase [Pseudomonas extremaustralis]|uniref:SDR family oxidoreductase n=1 Tax=Pseudomonas extremaustralis TaxID=359110 RepID=UPI0021C9FDCD|nr:SDR family NAD(P)-dependent oxidoreductase [Pseudomonas extremaustralis]MDG2966101.1 SDR family NAD(P)-dependent oxidoreductase [Pseudomonas extremaustralis]UUJ39907.1 SDR family NAD(P)-dependent oxidoreductase [Pseudomonas extremaustralis]